MSLFKNKTFIYGAAYGYSLPKEDGKKGEDTLQKLKNTLMEKFFSVVVDNSGGPLQDLMRKLQHLIYVTQKKIIEQFYVSLFFFAGCMFMVLSLLFYLIDTLHWSRSKALLVAGALLLVISAAMKQYVLRTRSI